MRRIRHRHISAVLGALAMLGLTRALSACGGDGSGNAKAATPAAAAAKTVQAAPAAAAGESIELVIKSDTEHGKKGPDGSWHDAFLPSGFTVHEGATVTVTVQNYDDMPHSFTAPALGVDKVIPAGSEVTPSTATFTFTAATTGSFLWYCRLPCDPWSMAHVGYMRGYVTVV